MFTVAIMCGGGFIQGAMLGASGILGAGVFGAVLGAVVRGVCLMNIAMLGFSLRS